MPTYMRWKDIGATCFFTVVTHGRRPWFTRADHRRRLGSAFRDACHRMPFTIDAIVLLPDHLHVPMTPADGVDYSALWRLIKTSFTQRLLPALTAHDPARSGRSPQRRQVRMEANDCAPAPSAYGAN